MSAVNREVTIKIDDSFTGPVCDYSVGFLKFRQEGKTEVADPMGTGTFVKLGQLYGILTAGHVLEQFGSEETVGLVRFPSIHPALQNRRLNLGHTKRVMDWNGKECDAPDIAFVSIPEVDARELEARGAIFYNLGLSRDFKPGTDGNRMSTCYTLVGVVGEWTEEGSAGYTKGRKIDIGGLFGAAKSVRPFHEDGNDLIEIEVSYETGPRIPRSYGGVSGGALWELHVELDKNLTVVKVNKKLHGVAFRQSGDRKRLTASAPALIDAFVKNKIINAARIKKKLAIDAVEAETVKLIFRLYRQGDGTSGPLGVKNLTSWLNERGYRTRRCARFGLATVHGILSNKVYMGEWILNRRDSRTLKQKPANEHVTVEVPVIIPRAEFEAVAAALKTRDPRVTSPRVVTGPILLTGIATCAGCGGAMTLRTGTSSTGKVHKYYTCSTCARQGKVGCKGRSVPMDKLDSIVVENLAERLFQPERLKVLLGKLAERRSEQAAEVDQRVSALRSELTTAEDKLKRLYTMVENGLTEMDDILKDRIAALKTDRDRAKDALERIKVRPKVHAFDAQAIERFGRLMRENITSGPIPFRKAYIKSVVDRVEVDDHAIRIVGDKATLEQVIAGDQTANPDVRSFVRNWRARRDSNS